MNVCIAIGNSDDKLSQQQWSEYVTGVNDEITYYQDGRHGEFYSLSCSRWQNACWWIEIYGEDDVNDLKDALRRVAKEFGQESIAWLAGETEFVSGVEE